MVKIAVLDDYQGVALSKADWGSIPGGEVTVFRDNLVEPEALARRLADFEIVCLMRERTPMPRPVFERLTKLKLLITTGARNASVDMQAAADHNVTVSGTRGTQPPTAELTWALILACMRQVAFEDRAMRRGQWQSTVGRTMAGATLGLLGLGRLGSYVAKIGKAFDMNLIAWSQNLTEAKAAEAGARLVAKDELLRTADVVTIHLVLSDRSRGLVGARELGLMKPTAYLINTSRGPIVDEAALVQALRQRRIAGAGLDVYDREPLPADHVLRGLDNVVLTPHLGYVTEDTYSVFYPDTVENIKGWLAGNPVRVIKA
jgi:phosphoglycerate dehydrogenase-like enzyme